MNFVSAPLPLNEERRAQAVARTGLMDSNQAELFNVYCEIAKDITGYETVLFQLFGNFDKHLLVQKGRNALEKVLCNVFCQNAKYYQSFHNFIDIYQILIKLVPIESPLQELSIGTNFIRI